MGQKHEQFLVPRDAQLQLFTQELLQKSQSAWPVRGILLSLGSKDGVFLEQLKDKQKTNQNKNPWIGREINTRSNI